MFQCLTQDVDQIGWHVVEPPPRRAGAGVDHGRASEARGRFDSMKLRTKRVLGVVGVLVGAGTIGAAALIGAATGDQERVASLQIKARFAENGNAHVREMIDYDFGAVSGDKHGINRTVPGLTTDAGISVSSPDAPDQFVVSNEADGRKIKIGDPDQKVSNRRRYEIGYQISGLMRGNELAFDAVGTAWDIPIRSASIDIAVPWVATAVRCDRGTTGDTGGCDAEQVTPGHLRVTVDDLDKGEGVTIYATAGDDLAVAPSLEAFEAPPADDSPALAVPAMVALIAAFIGGCIALVAIRRAGREWVGPANATALRSPIGANPSYANLSPPPGYGLTPAAPATPPGEERVDAAALGDLVTPGFTPPAGLTPAHGSIVLAESVTNDAKAAWLVDQTIGGAVTFDEATGTKQLLRDPNATVALPPILAKAFGSRYAISLDSYDAQFGAAWKDLTAELNAWRSGSGLWDPAGDRRRKWALGLGAMGVVLGLIGTGLAAHFGLTPLVALAAVLGGLGVAALATAWELPVRTPAGTATWLEAEAFRRFLRDSEVQQVDWAVQNGVLHQYTAWAVAVGEITRWNDALSRSTVARSLNPHAFAYAAMSRSFASATQTASTSPSSSGGGGVGGGGGGGGGGSW